MDVKQHLKKKRKKERKKEGKKNWSRNKKFRQGKVCKVLINYVGVSSQTASSAAVSDRRHSSSLDLPTFGRYTRSNFEKEAEPAQLQPSLTHFRSIYTFKFWERGRAGTAPALIHLPTFGRYTFKFWERGTPGTVPAFTYPLFIDTRSRFEKVADPACLISRWVGAVVTSWGRPLFDPVSGGPG